jgi:ATP-dependent DNA helicase RecG
MLSLADTSVITLKGVGAKVAEKLSKLGLKNLQDIIFHLPLRYEDRTRVYAIGDLYAGIHATVVAQVLNADIKYGRKRMLIVQVSDGSDILNLRFFHLKKGLPFELLVRCVRALQAIGK